MWLAGGVPDSSQWKGLVPILQVRSGAWNSCPEAGGPEAVDSRASVCGLQVCVRMGHGFFTCGFGWGDQPYVELGACWSGVPRVSRSAERRWELRRSVLGVAWTGACGH